MRKLIAMLLMLTLCICGAAAAEVSIDLSAMSLDELVELHKLVDAEIDARIACEPSVFPAGVYIAGESIKAGDYTIYGSEQYHSFMVEIFDSEKIFEQYVLERNSSLMSFWTSVREDDSVFVHLEEGMVLVVGGTSLIEVAQVAWLP